MAKFPYSPAPNKVKSFFEKVQEVGIPKNVTIKYVKSLGFTSSNDQYIPGILKALGFIDGSSVPTEKWRRFRNKKQAPKVMAQSIYETYSSLFNMYPDAFRKDDEALINFFSSHTEVGEKAVKLMVRTFNALCDLADFEILGVDITPSYEEEAKKKIEEKIPTTSEAPSARELTINVNIQFQLPATDDASIYDKLFESLKKHILSE